MRRASGTSISFAALALVAALIAACSSENVTLPGGGSPLTGLTGVATNDSSTGVTNPGGPGYFRGTVVGPSPVGAGGDTLAAAPRIANVRVTIYTQKSYTGGSVDVGEEKGSVLTDAEGKFTLPTVPAGAYVVTFTPPAGSGYSGGYSTGNVHANSPNYPWWVVLRKN
jgi:hypothetical protein